MATMWPCRSITPGGKGDRARKKPSWIQRWLKSYPECPVERRALVDACQMMGISHAFDFHGHRCNLQLPKWPELQDFMTDYNTYSKLLEPSDLSPEQGPSQQLRKKRSDLTTSPFLHAQHAQTQYTHTPKHSIRTVHKTKTPRTIIKKGGLGQPL